MAPLHHHFATDKEDGEEGWSETQITQRFWIVAVLAAMLGIALALL
jgi:phospho-N-acetylmuramoyl-pentapeptide-transferase